MKQLLFLITMGLVFTSCDPCNNLECLSSNYSGQFRIISKSNGADLIFGANAVYNKSNLKFYTLNATDTVFYGFNTEKYSANGYDSILSINFYPEIKSPIYLQLSDSDTDTLTINYYSYDTKCCGTITEIKNIVYNTSLVLMGSAGPQEIIK